MPSSSPPLRFALPLIIACALLSAASSVFLTRQHGVFVSAQTHETPQQKNDRLLRRAAELSQELVNWTNQYVASRNAKSLLPQGIELAANRRSLLKQLIVSDPEGALSLALPPETKRHMPLEVQANLEEEVSAVGDFLVFVVDEIDRSNGRFTGSRTEREVVIGGARYIAFVYGRRAGMTTKLEIPLQGMVVDGLMAVEDSPVKKLEPATYSLYKVDLTRLGVNGVAAEIGGEVVYFANQNELDGFVHQQVEWESKLGPTRPESGERPQSTWTEGVKTVLMMRVDFSDKPGEPTDTSLQPLTITRAQNLINNEVSPFYVNSSYNKTSLQVTVTTVLRLPQTRAFYELGNNYSTMLSDARVVARTAGFETNDFNLDVVAFSYSSNLGWAGRGSLGGKGAWLNGYFDLRVTAHEFGHNYGLHHANLWQTSDGSVIGPGSDIEYGDSFDMMGFGGGPEQHFNARYKRTLEWLLDENVQTVTNTGVYRVFTQDSPTSGGIRVLRIRKDSLKDYWVEFRQLNTNPNALNGATIRWDYQSGSLRRTQLLDMTPTTSGSTFDAPLVVGQSFDDSVNRIRVTVLGKGNTTPESLDVRVELNVGCTFSLAQTSQSFSASGGEGSIPVNTQSGCKPPAASNSDWLYAVTGENSPVRYVVAANYSSQARTGTITVSGQTFTVEQSGATTACAPQPPGLVAWWRADGNAVDQTGVNNGSLVSNMTFGGGIVGGAFQGDQIINNGSVEVPDSPSLDLHESMTIEGWLKISSSGGSVLVRRVAGAFARSYELWLPSNGELNFTIWYSGGSGVSVYSNPLPLNQFVHFAASLDHATNQVKMFINGSLVRQFTITQRPSVLANARIYIGDINGLTDELSVYNRALTASEILAIYNAGIAGTGAAGKCLTPTAPPPPAPVANAATNVTTTGFTANWSSSNGATGYRLDLSTNNSFSSYVSGYQNLDVGNVLSLNISGLSSATSYYYRLRAYNNGSASDNSNVIGVSTPAGGPPAPTANPGSNTTHNSFTANWTSSSGATGYRLDVSTNSSFSSFVTGYQNLDVGNALSGSITGLATSTLYYYRVRAYNSGGTSGNSNTVTVSTSGPIIFVEQGTLNRAAVLDSVTWMPGPFRVLNLGNLSTDHHTRVILFTSDLGLTQPDASQLTVRVGGVDLAIEGVGAVLGVPGMSASYIVVKLPEGLPSGDLPIIVTLRGVASVNSPTLTIAP